MTTNLPKSGHAGGIAPCLCLEDAYPMVIRVKEDATRLYAADDRWMHLGELYRSWAIRILDQIEGRECPVIESGVDDRGHYHNIRLVPKVSAPSLVGIMTDYPFVQVPHEYVTVVKPLFKRAL